jgi:hypothetical protein
VKHRTRTVDEGLEPVVGVGVCKEVVALGLVVTKSRQTAGEARDGTRDAARGRICQAGVDCDAELASTRQALRTT